MLNIITKFFKSFKDYNLIKKISLKNSIIFYAETRADWTYFKSIINDLSKMKIEIIKITSDIEDNILQQHDSYYLGNGAFLTLFFKFLDCKIIFMTLTDLDNFHIKKSDNNVKYIYIFHSLISTHRSYRFKAFDAYDTIFCPTKLHIDEIRKSEKLYNLPKKNLIPFGYPRLDDLLKLKKKFKKNYHDFEFSILIAPTWGKSSLNFYDLINIIDVLIENNILINLRFHSMTFTNEKSLIRKIEKKYSKKNNLIIDNKINNVDTFLSSDYLITDWSGSSFEFAFSNLKPVIFIDKIKKINNAKWQEVSNDCLEELAREEIGVILKIENINNIINVIRKFRENEDYWYKKILEFRNKHIYNINESSNYGSEYIKNNFF